MAYSPPTAACRSQVTPAVRGRVNQTEAPGTPAEPHAAMTWAQRLKRVFNIDIQTCTACGGTFKVIACIEDPAVIDKILTHLRCGACGSHDTSIRICYTGAGEFEWGKCHDKG